MECGSGKEAELPVLGDTGSHCHTVTVGTTHSVVVGRWWLVDWLVGWLVDWLIGWLIGWLVGWSYVRGPRFVVDNRGRWPMAFRPSEPSVSSDSSRVRVQSSVCIDGRCNADRERIPR